jgi:ribonuclease-3
VSRKLYELFPGRSEGQLTRLRSALVSDSHLAQKARALTIGRCMQLGRGEMLSGGRDKDSILAAAYESLVAAIYLDGGLEAARSVVEREFAADMEALGHKPAPRDYKTALKEILEAEGRPEPRYQVIETTGPDHRKRFHVVALVEGAEAGRGTGLSKKDAEQRAARHALEGREGRRID